MPALTGLGILFGRVFYKDAAPDGAGVFGAITKGAALAIPASDVLPNSQLPSAISQ